MESQIARYFQAPSPSSGQQVSAAGQMSPAQNSGNRNDLSALSNGSSAQQEQQPSALGNGSAPSPSLQIALDANGSNSSEAFQRANSTASSSGSKLDLLRQSSAASASSGSTDGSDKSSTAGSPKDKKALIRAKSYILTRRGSRRQKKDVATYLIIREQLAYDTKLRKLNVWIFAFALLGVAALMINSEVCWSDTTLLLEDGWGQCIGGQIAKSISLASSLLVELLLIRYYQVESKRKALQWKLRSSWEAFTHSSLWWRYAIEAIICIIQPAPFASSVYGLGPKIVVVMMVLRLYLFLRLLRDFSPVYRERHTLCEGTEFDSPEFQLDAFTVLKSYFFTYTVVIVVCSFLLCGMALGYIIHIIERTWWLPRPSASGLDLSAINSYEGFDSTHYQPSKFTRYGNCLWFMGVTMMTIGYGDMIPASWQGEVCALVASSCGLIMSSLTISVITHKLSPTPFQQYVIEWLKRGAVEFKKRTIAAMIIQMAWRDYRERKLAAERREQYAKLREERKTALVENATMDSEFAPVLAQELRSRLKDAHLHAFTENAKAKKHKRRTSMRLVKELRRAKRLEKDEQLRGTALSEGGNDDKRGNSKAKSPANGSSNGSGSPRLDSDDASLSSPPVSRTNSASGKSVRFASALSLDELSLDAKSSSLTIDEEHDEQQQQQQQQAAKAQAELDNRVQQLQTRVEHMDRTIGRMASQMDRLVSLMHALHPALMPSLHSFPLPPPMQQQQQQQLQLTLAAPSALAPQPALELKQTSLLAAGLNGAPKASLAPNPSAVELQPASLQQQQPQLQQQQQQQQQQQSPPSMQHQHRALPVPAVVRAPKGTSRFAQLVARANEVNRSSAAATGAAAAAPISISTANSIAPTDSGSSPAATAGTGSRRGSSSASVRSPTLLSPSTAADSHTRRPSGSAGSGSAANPGSSSPRPAHSPRTPSGGNSTSSSLNFVNTAGAGVRFHVSPDIQL